MIKVKLFVVLLVFFVQVAFSSAFNTQNTADAFRVALNERDVYYSLIFSDPLGIDSLILQPILWKQKLGQMRQDNTWYYFLNGVALVSNEKASTAAFQRALRYARKDPGLLWVLFLEFERVGNRIWAERTLHMLSAKMLAGGVTEVPIIRISLEHLASQTFEESDQDKAQRYLEYARLFTDNTVHIALTQLFTGGARDVPSLLGEIQYFLSHDWRVQTVFLCVILRFSAIFFLVSIVMIFLFTLVRTFTRTIHPEMCLYSRSIPYWLRGLFVAFIVLSCVAIGGIYPLACILAFMMYRSLRPGLNRRLMQYLLVVLCVLPFYSYVSAAAYNLLSYREVMGLYQRAVFGVADEELEKEVQRAFERDISKQEKVLLLVSQAVIEYKRGAVSEARYFSNLAMEIDSSNEAVLLVAGSIAMRVGTGEEGLALFQKAMTEHPYSAEAQYNFGQASFELVKVLDGTEYITNATRMSPIKVSTFIERNASYFGSDNWPVARHFFISSISPQQYWQMLPGLLQNSVARADILWGALFFGVSPLLTVGLVLSIMIISSIVTVRSARGHKGVEECSLCGKTICYRCRDDSLCHECSAMFHLLSNQALIETKKVKIFNGKRRRMRLRGLFMNVLIPGSRDIFLRNESFPKTTVLIPISMIVVSLYFGIWGAQWTLFPSVETPTKLVLTVPLVLYNLFFLVKFFIDLKKEKRSIKV